ncbi:MAG: TfoX/Sxy family protein [Syntrophobacterales bacterium]
MAVSDEFLEYVVEQLADWAEVQARRMFGGVGLYCQGRMFGLIADDILYFKVSDLNRDDFKKAGSLPFRPYPHKKITMSYWEIPGEVLEDRDELARWAAKSLAVTKKP